MFLLKFNAIEVYQKKKKNQWIQNGEKEDEEEEDEEVGWDAGFIHAGPLLFFLSFFFSFFNNRPNPVPAGIYISAEIGRNCPE